MAVDTSCEAGKVISGLGGLLQYGSIGLALAVVLVLFASVIMLMKQAPADRGGAFGQTVQLMKYGMGVIIILFVVSIVGPPVAQRWGVNPPSKYEVSFSMNPAEIDGDGLVPKLVVVGSGMPILLKEGTGLDTIEGTRSYMIKVGALVGEIDRLKKLVARQQYEFTRPGANNDHQ